jgi:hypothetical protein
LIAQKAELENTLAGIASEEEKLAVQRKDIQVALNQITTCISVLSGQPFPVNKPVPATTTGATRKPMSAEARQRIAEGLRRAAQLKALAKTAQGATPAPQDSAPAPADALAEVPPPEAPVEVPADVPVEDSASQTHVEVPTDAPVVVSGPQEPAEAPADVPVPVSPRGPKEPRKRVKA